MIQMKVTEEDQLALSMVTGMSLKKRRFEGNSSHHGKGNSDSEGKRQRFLTELPHQQSEVTNQEFFGKFSMGTTNLRLRRWA